MNCNITPFLLLDSIAWSTFPTTLTTKHFFKFFKNVSKTTTSLLKVASLSPSRKSLEPLKSLEWILATKWILLLFITCHTSLIINSSFTIITQSFISIVNTCKFFFSFWGFINIRMEFFCQCKICLFNFILWRRFWYSKFIIEVLFV